MTRRISASLVHNGLFAPADRTGIYWLRLYRLPQSRPAAVLTEVPGNPGMSVSNAASMLAKEVAEAFGISREELEIFTVWPRFQYPDGPAEAATYSQAPGPSGAQWRETSRRRIEALVGPMPPLPEHDSLFSAVLARGGSKHEWGRDIWEAVSVTSLPPFRGPYQCKHHARFQSMLRDPGHSTAQEELAAGRAFIASLTLADRAQCRYHQGNWRAIADASAEIIATIDANDPDACEIAVQAMDLPAREERWLHSLFANAIVLSDNRTSFINGQHRGCALRFSGAKRAAVVVDHETIVEDHADWTYLGDG